MRTTLCPACINDNRNKLTSEPYDRLIAQLQYQMCIKHSHLELVMESEMHEADLKINDWKQNED